MVITSLVMHSGKPSATVEPILAVITIGGISLLILTLYLAAQIYLRAARKANRASERYTSELGGVPGILEDILDVDGSPPPNCYYLDEEALYSLRDQIPSARRESGMQLLPPAKGSAQKRLREALKYYHQRDQIDQVNLMAGTDEAPILGLLAQIEIFEGKNKFEILRSNPDDILKSWREQKTQKGAQLLYDRRGYIAIRAQFEVTQDADGAIVLTAWAELSRKASATIRLESKDMRSAGWSMLRPGRKLPLNCIGETPGWDPDRQELALAPVAVFSHASSGRPERS